MEQLTNENFKKKLSKRLAIIDFFADWCGPCRMLGPEFEKASQEVTDVLFAKIDVQEEQELAMKFQVRSIPCLIIFKDGEEIDRIIGYVNKEQIKVKLAALYQ